MKCPLCRNESKVLDSRKRLTRTTRRRVCLSCGHRFTTKEVVNIQEPKLTLEEISAQIADLAKKLDHRPRNTSPRKPKGPQWPKPDLSLTQAERDALREAEHG